MLMVYGSNLSTLSTYSNFFPFLFLLTSFRLILMLNCLVHAYAEAILCSDLRLLSCRTMLFKVSYVILYITAFIRLSINEWKKIELNSKFLCVFYSGYPFSGNSNTILKQDCFSILDYFFVYGL